MRCPSCGFDNPEGLKFCNECGTSFKRRCAQCGFENAPQAKFCGECGTTLSGKSKVKNQKAKGKSASSPSQPPASYTPRHLAERIRAATRSSSEIVKIPYDQAYEAGFEDMPRRVPDLSKIHALIGYTPKVGLEEIIERGFIYSSVGRPRIG